METTAIQLTREINRRSTDSRDNISQASRNLEIFKTSFLLRTEQMATIILSYAQTAKRFNNLSLQIIQTIIANQNPQEMSNFASALILQTSLSKDIINTSQLNRITIQFILSFTEHQRTSITYRHQINTASFCQRNITSIRGQRYQRIHILYMRSATASPAIQLFNLDSQLLCNGYGSSIIFFSCAFQYATREKSVFHYRSASSAALMMVRTPLMPVTGLCGITSSNGLILPCAQRRIA